MKEDKLRTAWDDVKMSRQQDERIWRQACARVHNKSEKKVRRWPAASVIAAAAVCLIAAAGVFPTIISVFTASQSVMAEYPVELPETEQGEWKNYVLVHSAGKTVKNDINLFHMVVSVNETQKEIKLMYLPHSLMFVSCNEAKVCTSMLYFMSYLGGPETLTEYLSAQLNIPIEGCIALNDAAREAWIDMAGGVEVNTKETERTFDTLCGQIYQWNEGLEDDAAKPQTLMGNSAVEWCDTNYSLNDGFDASDEASASARCTEVIFKTFEGLKEQSELTKDKVQSQVAYLYDKNRLETDMEAETVGELIWQVIEGEYQICDVRNLGDCEAVKDNEELSVKRAGRYITDWTAWLTYIAEYLYGEPAGNEAQTAELLKETFIQYLGVNERGRNVGEASAAEAYIK